MLVRVVFANVVALLADAGVRVSHALGAEKQTVDKVGVKVSHASARTGGLSCKCVVIHEHVSSSVLSLLSCLCCDVGVRVSHAGARHEGQSHWFVCACALVPVSTVFADVVALLGDVGVRVSHALGA